MSLSGNTRPLERVELEIPNLVFDARAGTDKESLKRQFLNHLHYTLAKDRYTATKRDCYFALAQTVRDHLVGQWIETQQQYYKQGVKRVHYLSMEFLIGRTLGNSLINLGLYQTVQEALAELGLDIREIREMEWDAGLGNGGLGRLAACFLDSMATMGIPGYGYGIRYEYGIFSQSIENGYQVESPDNWLRYGNVWEIARPEYLYPLHFHGRIEEQINSAGHKHVAWVDTDVVMAVAYDTPIPGYLNGTVNTMRLWAGKSSRGFDLSYFNHGDYIRAVEDKSTSENISRVLYPNDNVYEGKELRLKQEYFLVSASLQDILRRFRRTESDWTNLPKKNVIQLNDTHPALAIPELMHILVDQEGLPWHTAWDITKETFCYTNHTILPEALEQWPTHLLKDCLPRHLQIIHEINRRFLDEEVRIQYPNNVEKIQKLSLIAEDEQKSVRMANLCIVGSKKVNGVSELHTKLIQENLFNDFHKLYPNKIQPATNGVTPRRWLKKCNPLLSSLITETIGSDWVTELDELEKLIPYAQDKEFRKKWRQVKQANKKRLSEYLQQADQIVVDPETMFAVQIKRMHEYKRQLLNVLFVIDRYNQIKDHPDQDFVPRTVMIGGKAAPGYYLAKLIIKLIHSVGNIVNNDPAVKDRLKLFFLPNYRVSLAEKVIPAMDLSEQISLAGLEASGTGNMKGTLNGALTIGTLDGANVEIMEEVGRENIFIFGLTTEQVAEIKEKGHDTWKIYNEQPRIARCLDMIRHGFFSPENRHLFGPVFDSLLDGGDQYLLLEDFQSYIDCQDSVDKLWLDQDRWTEMSILNTARVGKFSSDRSIIDYANNIWDMSL